MSDLLNNSPEKRPFGLWNLFGFLTSPFRFLGRGIARQWRLMWVAIHKRVIPDAIPFQVGIDTIIAENPSFLMMSVFYLLGIGFVTLVVIASIVEIEMIVTCTGRLTTETPPLQLQPMDRAIIRELKVKAGDVVSKGQILATFDATFAHADLASLLAQQKAILVQIRRLEHEYNHTPFDVGHTSNLDERLQATLLEQRKAQYKSRLLMFDEEIQRLKANIRSTEDERNSLATLLEISKDVEGMRKTLKKAGTGSQLQYQDSQVVRIRTEQSHQEAGNRLIELRHNLEAKKAERQTFVDEWSRQVLDNLIALRTEATKINELVVKAQRMSDMEIMTSPVDGVVLDVAKRATGSVLNPAELLITLVPSNVELIAEVTLNSMDVGYLQPDDKVVIKVGAFPYQKHGMLEGRMMYISQESFQMNSAGGKEPTAEARSVDGAFHVGKIKLTKTELAHMSENARLIRGMTITANIKVGKRTVMSYFLYAFTSILDESLRER